MSTYFLCGQRRNLKKSNPRSLSPCVCAGESPINVVPTATTVPNTDPVITLSGYDKDRKSLPIFNNGHTVGYSVCPNSFDCGINANFGTWPSTLRGISPAQNDDYFLLQMHFHWGSDATKGSEHTARYLAHLTPLPFSPPPKACFITRICLTTRLPVPFSFLLLLQGLRHRARSRASCGVGEPAQHHVDPHRPRVRPPPCGEEALLSEVASCELWKKNACTCLKPVLPIFPRSRRFAPNPPLKKDKGNEKTCLTLGSVPRFLLLLCFWSREYANKHFV